MYKITGFLKTVNYNFKNFCEIIHKIITHKNKARLIALHMKRWDETIKIAIKCDEESSE